MEPFLEFCGGVAHTCDSNIMSFRHVEIVIQLASMSNTAINKLTGRANLVGSQPLAGNVTP